jgi:hypothetical protein
MTLADILNFLLFPPQTPGLMIFKYTLLFFTFFFAFLIVWLSIKSTFWKRLFIWDLIEVLTFRAYKLGGYSQRWKKIISKLEKKSEAEAKLAILEADSLLDEVLKKSGYPGETLTERLEKLTPATLPNLEELKKARQVRESIISDPTYRLEFGKAKEILKIYEKALTYLEAL